MKRLTRLILLLIILLFGCGKHSSTLAPADGIPQTHDGAVTLEQDLRELDALQPAPGTNPRVFGQLKQAMREMLLSRGVSRFVSTPPLNQQNQVKDVTAGYNDAGLPAVQWNYKNVGDYDFNGEVNISDLTQIGVHYGKNTNSPDWDNAQFADGDGNGIVNVSDLTPLGSNIHNRVWGWALEGSASPDGPWTSLGTVSRVSGAKKLPTGMLIYIIPPVQTFAYYRVAPLDNDLNRGIDSAVSVQFIISARTRIVGAPGGPAYTSRSGDQITLSSPGGPTNISVGDILVGSNDGGYLLKVTSVAQNGDQVIVEGTPAALTDVFIQGGIGTLFSKNTASIHGKSTSNPPPPQYDFDISGQTICSTDSLTVDIPSGVFNFLPDADVAINYNKYGGVTYMKALLKGDALKLNMTAHAAAVDFSGTVPATEAERSFYEKRYTSLTFNFTVQQNGVPIVMAMQYDIYLGVEAQGNMNGDYNASMESLYENILLGGIFKSDWLEEHHEFTPLFGNVNAPTFDEPTQSGDFSMRVYVRPEVHARLYGNPIPGNTEDLDLRAIPYMRLTSSRVTAPSDGHNYTLTGGMDSSYKLALNHIGLPSQVQQNFFADPGSVMKSGFVPDTGTATEYGIRGAIMDDGVPLEGIAVELKDQSTGGIIGTDVTDVEGAYDFSQIAAGTQVQVKPRSGAYTFTPAFANFTMTTDQSQDFEADLIPPS